MSLEGLGDIFNRSHPQLYSRRFYGGPSPTTTTPSVYQTNQITQLLKRVDELEKKLGIQSSQTGWICPKCNFVHNPSVKTCVCHTNLRIL